jgi:phosphoglycerate dehydrogenase-like enzyme
MKPSACLINIARGELIDEAAVRDALCAGRLRAAALDVFAREPLPPDSPWWATPNVLINPHNSGNSERFWERLLALFSRNLRRFLANEPLENLIPKDRGF